MHLNIPLRLVHFTYLHNLVVAFPAEIQMTPQNTLWVKYYTGNSVRLWNDSWFMIVWFPVIAILNVKALLAPKPGIFDVITEIKLTDPISEVVVTEYQQTHEGPWKKKTRKKDKHVLKRIYEWSNNTKGVSIHLIPSTISIHVHIFDLIVWLVFLLGSGFGICNICDASMTCPSYLP